MLERGSAGFMAGYSALVCLAAGESDLHRAVDRALAPHRENWRAWSIDAEFDLEALRNDSMTQAREAWRFWQEVLEVYPAPVDMEELRGHCETEPTGFMRARLESEYREQPAISEVWALAGLTSDPGVLDSYPRHSRLLRRWFVRAHDLVRHFGDDEPELVADERARACATDVLVTAQGRWVETPRSPCAVDECLMGGACFDLTVLRPYYALRDEYLDAIALDTTVVAVHFRF
jgi:hypothetical protein